MKFKSEITLKAKRIDTGDEKNIRLIIGGRASFCDIVEPTEYLGKQFFSATILLPKDDIPKETANVLNTAVQDAIAVGVKTRWNNQKPDDLQLPLRSGAKKFKDNPDTYDAYEHCVYLVAKKHSPTVGPVVMANGKRVYDVDTVASGDWCAFDVSLYPYKKGGNKGIAVGLNGVTLIKNGERFSGAPTEDSVSQGSADLYGEEMDDANYAPAQSSSDNFLDDIE